MNNVKEKLMTDIVAQNYGCSPLFISYYIRTLNISDEELLSALSKIPKDKQYEFSQDIADRAIYQARKEKHSLCIVVPTYKREKRIQTWLEQSARKYYQCGIDILFVDSSENPLTKDLIKKSNFENVFYEAFDDNSKTIKDTIDEKVYYCFKVIAGKYDAIWPCHDVAMPEVQNIYRIFVNAYDNNTDLIVVQPFYVPNGVHIIKEYTDIKKLILDQFGAMTSLSSVIYFSKLTNEIAQNYPVIENINDGLWLPTVIFHALANVKFKATYIELPNLFNHIPDNGASFWLKNKSVLKLYTKRWPNIVKNLPEFYNDIREDILYNGLKEVNFNTDFLAYCRATGNFSFIDILQHWCFMKKLTKRQFIPLVVFSLYPLCIAKSWIRHPGRRPKKLVKQINKLIDKFNNK